MDGRVVVFGLYLAVSLLWFLLGLPLWLQKVGPNRWYGFRTATTLHNEDLWYPVNRVVGVWMMRTAAITELVAIGTFLARLPVDVAAIANLIPWMIGLMMMTAHGLYLVHCWKRDQSLHGFDDWT